MAQIVSIKDKRRIVKIIKKHILKDGNGYAAITWASKQVLGNNFSPKPYVIESVAAIATKTGKYKKELVVGENVFDYNISINSDSNWLKRNPFVAEIIRFIITVVSSVLVVYLTS